MAITSGQKANFNGRFKLKLITTFQYRICCENVVNIALIKNCPNKYKLAQKFIEFGTSPMFTIIATLALLNAFCFVGRLKRLIANVETLVWERFALQILLCGMLDFINLSGKTLLACAPQ